jgi:hypothetical protein
MISGTSVERTSYGLLVTSSPVAAAAAASLSLMGV